MRRLALKLLTLASALTFALAPAAAAYNDGRGFYGGTNDKVVTNAGFIVIGFFALFVLMMSLLQRLQAQGGAQGRPRRAAGPRALARWLVAADAAVGGRAC